jgi:hypothetical protein
MKRFGSPLPCNEVRDGKLAESTYKVPRIFQLFSDKFTDPNRHRPVSKPSSAGERSPAALFNSRSRKNSHGR